MSIRNFTWADLPALHELVNPVGSSGDDDPASFSSLKERLLLPGLALEENCFLFEHGQELRAYALIYPELRIGRTVLEMAIHHGHLNAATVKEVVNAAQAHARTFKAKVLHVCVPDEEFWTPALEGCGLSHARDYWLMRWEGQALPPADLPADFGIETFQPGDEWRLTQVQNSAFEGSWGFCPNTVEEIAYRSRMTISPREGIIFLTHGSDTAGYCWTCTEGTAPNAVGVIGMIGVVPEYRGRGLAKPILLAGMDYLSSQDVVHIRLDVDAQNTPAIRLYASLGFEKTADLHWFEASLSEV